MGDEPPVNGGTIIGHVQIIATGEPGTFEIKSMAVSEARGMARALDAALSRRQSHIVALEMCTG